jgi:hypothetical protein
MKALNTLSQIGERARENWNMYPRLRVGSVIIIAWIAAIPAMRSAEHLFLVKWGIVGLLSIGIAFAMNGLASMIGKWRTTEWPDVSDNNEWPDRTPSEPTSPPNDLRNGYEYSGAQTLPNAEYQGKAVSWALLLWWSVLSLLFAIILWRPAPSPFTLEGVAAVGFVGVVFAAMVVAHEGLHALVARIYGADVSFGLAASGPYTEFRDVVLSRRQNILVLAAPLLVLTPASIATTLFANGLLLYAGIIVLLFNTTMACGDVYQIGYKFYCAPGLQVYYPSNGPPHLYYPEGQSRQSLLARLDTGITWLGALFTVPPLRSQAGEQND